MSITRSGQKLLYQKEPYLSRISFKKSKSFSKAAEEAVPRYAASLVGTAKQGIVRGLDPIRSIDKKAPES